VQNRIVGKVAGDGGYYPTSPSRIDEC